MQTDKLDNATAITREIYWVGFFEETSKLQCNPFLLLDDKDVVLFDPGSVPDFPKIMRKVIDLINPHEITWIVSSHQDPDVCGNLAVVEDVIDNPNLRIAAHTNTVRLIQHLGLRSEFYPVDRHDYRATLQSGRELRFIYMPYLHSPGAIVTFDPKSGALFSGDLFGAISKTWDIFDTQGFPHSMDEFHQAYIPSNAVLRKGLQRLEGLPISMILPQHGSVIEGANVGRAIEYLKALPCGIDLME
jgi:flavorubredoxin